MSHALHQLGILEINTNSPVGVIDRRIFLLGVDGIWVNHIAFMYRVALKNFLICAHQNRPPNESTGGFVTLAS